MIAAGMEIPKGGSDENNKAGQRKYKVVYSAKKKKTPPPPNTAMPQIDAAVGEEEKMLKPSVDQQQHVQHLAEDNGNALENDDNIVSSSTVKDDSERAINDEVDIDIVDDWESADVGELVRFFLLMAKCYLSKFVFLRQ